MRKLTKQEALTYLDALTNGTKLVNPNFAAYIDKYFDKKNAHYLVLIYASEYNDETYNNKLATVVVLDKNKKELSPKAGMEIDARKAVFDLDYPDSVDPLDTKVINLNGEIPDLYVEI